MPYYEPNAPIDRLRWVAKTYEHMPVVAWETIRVALNTLGLDHIYMNNATFDGIGDGTWGAEFGRYESMSRTQFGFTRGALTAQRVSELLTMLEPELPSDTEYDFLFPWVAAQLGPIAKRTRRAWKQEHEGRLTHPHAMHWYDEAPLFMGIAEAFRERGSAIAQWALANRIDLGRVTAAEAIEGAKNFRLAGFPVLQGPVVFDFGDGWTVQELPPDALKAEGEVMQHCVGTYCERVRAGKTVIYSLRDPQGLPHVTMEVAPDAPGLAESMSQFGYAAGRFQQIYGKQNQPPKDEYKARVRAFIRDKFNAEPGSMIMAGADPKSLDLRGADLTGAHLAGADLMGADLAGANLHRANLTGVYLGGANLTRASMRNANLTDADMTDADLTGADLIGANLTRALLIGANLTGANLTVTDLTDADLHRANLTGVYLGGARTEGTIGL